MDWSRMPTGQNAASLCSRLSPENPDTPCISLRPFLEPSDNPYMQPQDEVTSPCKGDPCNSSEVCSVNRNCAPGRPCPPYQCSPGEETKLLGSESMFNLNLRGKFGSFILSEYRGEFISGFTWKVS
jgi:reversion-inducing cysteine-rich kazal motif protein